MIVAETGLSYVIGGACNVSFFGFCAAVALYMLLPCRAYLVMNPDGFSYKSLFKLDSYLWSDISGFSVRRYFFFFGVVTFNFAPALRDTPQGKKAAKCLPSMPGMPDTYGMNPQALADLMNEWRERAEGAKESNSN